MPKSLFPQLFGLIPFFLKKVAGAGDKSNFLEDLNTILIAKDIV